MPYHETRMPAVEAEAKRVRDDDSGVGFGAKNEPHGACPERRGVLRPRGGAGGVRVPVSVGGRNSPPPHKKARGLSPGVKRGPGPECHREVVDGPLAVPVSA